MKPSMKYLTDESVPSLEILKKAFKKIESTNLDELDYKDLKQFILNEIKLLPKVISLEEKFDTTIYRARVNIQANEDLGSIATYGAPPPKCTPRGRANLAQHPVFYGTVSQHAAIKEVKTFNTEDIYIGVWKPTKPIKLSMQIYVYSDDVHLDDVWKTTNTILVEKFKNLETRVAKEESRDAMLYLNLKVGGWFLSDDYTLSSCLGHSSLYEDRLSINAITYPSVSDKTGVNFAFNPQFISNNFHLEKVVKVQVQSV